MPHPTSHRRAAAPRTPKQAEIDTLLLDEEFDDVLDRHLAALRESLADARYR